MAEESRVEVPEDLGTSKGIEDANVDKIPATFIRAFTGEIDMGIVNHAGTDLEGIDLAQMTCGIAGGGLLQIEFPVEGVPAVIQGLRAMLEDYATRVDRGKEILARARAESAGIDIPVIEVPADIRGAGQ